MPTYTIAAPDGRKITIQAGDQATAIAGAQQWALSNPAGGRKLGPAPDPVTSYATTLARNFPGVSELGAGYSAAVRTAADLASGRAANFGARWNQARAEQQGTVDRFGQDHPVAAANAAALGTILPAAIGGGVGLARAGVGELAAAAQPVASGIRAAAGRIAASTGRNAMTGAAIGGLYGAAQPGTLEERAANGIAAMGPGAAAGVVAPAVLGAGARIARAVTPAASRATAVAGNAFRPGAVASSAPEVPASVAAGPGPASVEAAAPAAQPTAPPSVAAGPGPASAAVPPSVAAGPGPASAAAPAPAAAGLTPLETSALGKFVRVAKPDTNAMTGKAAAYNGVGIEPTLVDTSGRRGQAVVRALASRPGAGDALDNVDQFGRARVLNLSGRMADQVHDIVSSDPRDVPTISAQAKAAKLAQGDKDFAPIRPQLVSLTPEMVNALESPRGLDAIREAMRNTVDGTERDALNQVYQHIKPGQDGMLTGSLDGTKMTIGQLQDISKALFDKADVATVDQERGALTKFGTVIREGAKAQSPEYVAALKNYEDASTIGDAAKLGYTGLGKNTSALTAGMDALRAIPNGADAGLGLEPVGVPLARAGFARAIEDASGNGRPANALQVADTLADTRIQQQRNEALLGTEDADRLQSAMRLEAASVRNGYNASPSAGSNTYLNLLAGGAADGELNPGEVAKTMGSVAAATHGNVIPAAMQALQRYLSATRGFSDDEAAALANMAIDPSKHDDALAFIASRAGPQAAQQVAPIMQDVAASAGAAASAAAAPAPPPAQNAFQPNGPPPAQ